MLEFDLINNSSTEVETKRRGAPYNTYFGEMKLSNKEKQERISLAEEIELMMIFMFAYIDAMGELAPLYRQNIVDTFQERYTGIVGRYLVPDNYTEMYISTIVSEITDVTLRHIGVVSQGIESQTQNADDELLEVSDSAAKVAEKEYYLSDDRAMLIAAGEANSLLNYGDLKTAIFEGCKWKQWQTKEDRKVRETHAAVNGVTVGIHDLFKLGDSYMSFPRDISHGASVQEIAGCRCSLKYLK